MVHECPVNVHRKANNRLKIVTNRYENTTIVTGLPVAGR